MKIAQNLQKIHQQTCIHARNLQKINQERASMHKICRKAIKDVHPCTKSAENQSKEEISKERTLKRKRSQKKEISKERNLKRKKSQKKEISKEDNQKKEISKES